MTRTRPERATAPAVFLLWLALLFISLSASGADADRIGEVLEVSGVVGAQRPGAPARFLAKNEALFEGDVITTSNTGYIQVALKDGTRLTLRPNTTFAMDRVRHGAGEESATFRLLKGGVRALTGLISKRNPGGAEIRTTTATIGIRGTSLDARICETECAREESQAGKPAPAAASAIVARVASLTGNATATSREGQTRPLAQGGALFTGESVTTTAKSNVVLAFRDESRVTVSPDSIFRLEDVRFTGAKSESGSFLVRIAKGSVRMLTGLLGKSNPKAVGVRVGTATIGIRGSGFDGGLVTGTAGDENIVVDVWDGGATLSVGGETVVINQGQAATFQPATNTLGLVDKPPAFILPGVPRPDQIKVDHNNLFGTAQQTVEPGLYVSVRDGEVQLTAVGGTIVQPLGQGEVGFLATGSTTPVRITTPWFILNDNYPLPDAGVRSLIVPLKPQSGSLICEIN